MARYEEWIKRAKKGAITPDISSVRLTSPIHFVILYIRLIPKML